MLSVVNKPIYAECLYAECLYAERLYAECLYAECIYAECIYTKCLYAECRGAQSVFGSLKKKNLGNLFLKHFIFSLLVNGPNKLGYLSLANPSSLL